MSLLKQGHCFSTQGQFSSSETTTVLNSIGFAEDKFLFCDAAKSLNDLTDNYNFTNVCNYDFQNWRPIIISNVYIYSFTNVCNYNFKNVYNYNFTNVYSYNFQK